MADLSTKLYATLYHYSDDIFLLSEFSDGSIQHAYAYHYDMTNIGRYFVEFENGSVLSTKNRAPYVPLKPTDEYFRLDESQISSNKWCIEESPELKVNNEWCEEDFPELSVGAAGENAENNNVVQVFDKSPQRATHTSQGHVVDDMDSTRTGVEPSLESISTYLFSSLSCNEYTAPSAKLLFKNLIALPLEDLIDPENQTYMTKALSILADNLSLFSEEQAKRIIELKLEFPSLVHSWSEYSRSQMHSQKFFADLEKARNMVETSAEDEENLETRFNELQSKKKELMAQLDAVKLEQEGITAQRLEKSKQTNHLASLAEEKARGTKEKRLVMKIASTKLNNLVVQWAAIQSVFM